MGTNVAPVIADVVTVKLQGSEHIFEWPGFGVN